MESGKRIIAELKESLNPGMCRGLVDAFLTHKKNLEVKNFHSFQAFPLSRICRNSMISFRCPGR